MGNRKRCTYWDCLKIKKHPHGSIQGCLSLVGNSSIKVKAYSIHTYYNKEDEFITEIIFYIYVVTINRYKYYERKLF